MPKAHTLSQIKWGLKLANGPYLFYWRENRQWMIKPRAYGVAWIQHATMKDIERVSIPDNPWVEYDPDGPYSLDRILKSRRTNPKQPPKSWWDRCVKGVEEGSSAVDPKAVCGATWYRTMSGKQRRAATRKAEGKRNRNPRFGGWW